MEPVARLPSTADGDRSTSIGNPDVTATVGVVGASGVVGDRFRRRLASLRPDSLTLPLDTRTTSVARIVGRQTLDAVVLLQPGAHLSLAVDFAALGVPVVSIGDQVADVRRLLASGSVAEDADVPLVVGAGMSPGLVALLARHLSNGLERLDEIHVALHGTAGPSCARRHHRALAGHAVEWRDGHELDARAGTGRELVWFPEPVGAYDCYRAEMPTPIVLHRVFDGAERITVRVSANRRDRLTSRLPMLTPPHREGGVGAVRVEVRGPGSSGERLALVAGIAELVGTAAAATAVAITDRVLAGVVPSGVVALGDDRLDTVELLHLVERAGVRLQEFTGVPND